MTRDVGGIDCCSWHCWHCRTVDSMSWDIPGHTHTSRRDSSSGPPQGDLCVTDRAHVHDISPVSPHEISIKFILDTLTTRVCARRMAVRPAFRLFSMDVYTLQPFENFLQRTQIFFSRIGNEDVVNINDNPWDTMEWSFYGRVEYTRSRCYPEW